MLNKINLFLGLNQVYYWAKQMKKMKCDRFDAKGSPAKGWMRKNDPQLNVCYVLA